ncbi:MAG TPA: type IV secretion system protein [Rickettsiales bacterium]|nr:type IV secretion system protein [Rickettsiales bacterium]
MEEPNNYNNFDSEYKDSVKYCISNGIYFKDAFEWYCNKYLRPIVDRTFFVFMSIMGVIIIYSVVTIILSILPMKEDVFIAIREKDLTKYETTIHDLSKSKQAKSTDESILEYLICNYVKERESHNYKRANINDVNLKLQKIKNNSSADVFNDFKYFMGADNENGPYYYFGKNIETTVKIDSFNFIRVQRTKIIDKIIDYFNVKLMPIKAEVFYTVIMQIGDKVSYQKRKAILSFKFNGVEYSDETEKYSPLKFVIINYKNYSL